MSKVEVAKFEKKITVRQMREEDIDEIVELANLSFGIPGVAFEREHYESHIRIFPEGQFCVEYDGKIVGSCSSLIVNFDEYGEEHTFDEICGNGYIENHNPNGENLYGIDVVVHPDYQGLKIGRRLYEARRKLCRQLNLKSILFGGRMPNYHKYADKLTPHEYVEQVLKRNIYDPVITFQTMNGFVVRGILPNYLPHDKESLKYATLMEWHNEEYRPNLSLDYRRSLPVRIASVQFRLKQITSFDDFAAQCEYFVRSASNVRADFIVFPEAMTLQLLSLENEKVPSRQVRKLTRYTENYVQLFSEMAVKYDINIVSGTHFVEETVSLYNVAFLFQRNGTIDKQYKLHIPWNERKWWGVQPGDGLRVFETDCGKVAILIGYDIQFPELGRMAAEQGANILFTPFSAEDEQGFMRVRYCALARSVENELFTVVAGTVGHLSHVPQTPTQFGLSAVFSPCDYAFAGNGVIAEGQPNSEALVVGDIDLEQLRRNREIGSVTPLKDRRPHIYRLDETEKSGVVQ